MSTRSPNWPGSPGIDDLDAHGHLGHEREMASEMNAPPKPQTRQNTHQGAVVEPLRRNVAADAQ